MRPPVMVLGCTSDAGKSFLVMGLCRALANRGFSVAPFKAQNMSNNAAVTADGSEIGRAQFAQAQAARVEPDVRMNPVLLKPLSDTRGAVVLNGRHAPHVEALPWLERPTITWPVVEAALQSLMADFEMVVIEGAGSPAEINLRASDIVNMRVATAAEAECYLCSDIDRGGSFAHLLGTWHCLEPAEQRLLKGFVLNKFRGDPTLLADATDWLEARTGVPTVAVVPWIDHQLPEEDRHLVRNADLGGGQHEHTRVGIVLYPFAANTDEFDALGTTAGVEVITITEHDPLHDLDAVILPGSRNVAQSLAWLRESGVAEQLTRFVRRGGSVLGICGGMQLLGQRITDPHGVEGGDVTGLGLLDVVTELAAQKTTRPFQQRLLPTGVQVAGYEIHHGATIPTPGTAATPLFDDDLGWQQRRVSGVYAHALLEDLHFRRWWLGSIGHAAEGSAMDETWSDRLDTEYDRVANHLEATGFVDQVLGQRPR